MNGGASPRSVSIFAYLEAFVQVGQRNRTAAEAAVRVSFGQRRENLRRRELNDGRHTGACAVRPSSLREKAVRVACNPVMFLCRL